MQKKDREILRLRRRITAAEFELKRLKQQLQKSSTGDYSWEAWSQLLLGGKR